MNWPKSAVIPLSPVSRPNAGERRESPRIRTKQGDIAEIQAPNKAFKFPL